MKIIIKFTSSNNSITNFSKKTCLFLTKLIRIKLKKMDPIPKILEIRVFYALSIDVLVGLGQI